MEEMYDVVIIGSGLYGIQAARTYLDVHPQSKVVILEADKVIGGVWSSKRVYSTFISQTPLSMAQFSDLPLELALAEQKEHYPFVHAKYTAKYLEVYVHTHVYDNRSLHDRVLFNTRATKVTQEKSAGQTRWVIECQQRKTPESAAKAGDATTDITLKTSKLICCTGLASQPIIGSIPGASDFTGLILHSKDFAYHEPHILSPSPSSPNDLPEKTSQSPKHIAIIGGGKSAADIVYACATASGKSSTTFAPHVYWIIRPDGNGPAALLPPKAPESFYTRLVAAFLPFIPHKGRHGGVLERLLHSTSLGRWLVSKLWERVDRRYRADARFDREDGKANGFEGLESDTPVFWQNDGSGINQHDEFWDVVARRVKVFRKDIAHFDSDHLVLKNDVISGETQQLRLPVDVVVFCTGWSAKPDFIEDETAQLFGLPHDDSQKDLGKWQGMDADADAEVLSLFPSFAHPPEYRRLRPSLTPNRLYHTIAPIANHEDLSIIFLGALVVGNNFLVAEAQALWATAWLDGHIVVSVEDMRQSIARTVAWNRRRYLNKGQLGNWLFFDVVNYADVLLEEIGLRSHKSSWWHKRLLSPMRPGDLRGLLREYKALHPPGVAA